MAESADNSEKRKAKDVSKERNRPWVNSVLWSATAMAILLAVAVGLNLAIGRVIHWEIVTGLGVLGFVFLSIGRRYRTI